MQQSTALQCPKSPVPMVCTKPNRLPIFHMHFAKMAGRSVVMDGPQFLGQRVCHWAPARSEYHLNKTGRVGKDYGDSYAFKAAVHAHGAELKHTPCLTTFEMGWHEAISNTFRPANITPLVVLMLREPHSWALSAIEHDYRLHRHKGIDDLVQRGCFSPGNQSKPATCPVGYDYRRSKIQNLFDDVTDAVGKDGQRFERARIRLDSSIFGLVNEFEVSMCLWAFQMGTLSRSNPSLLQRCDCRSRESVVSSKVGHSSSHLTAELLHDASPAALAVLRRMVYPVDTDLFVYGTALFVQRVRFAERELSIQLLCGEATAPAAWLRSSSLKLDAPFR